MIWVGVEGILAAVITILMYLKYLHLARIVDIGQTPAPGWINILVGRSRGWGNERGRKEGEKMTEIPECLKPPEMQCVNCWHRWKPEQHFRDMPRCPECGSTWLVRVDYLNLALRVRGGNGQRFY